MEFEFRVLENGVGATERRLRTFGLEQRLANFVKGQRVNISGSADPVAAVAITLFP